MARIISLDALIPLLEGERTRTPGASLWLASATQLVVGNYPVPSAELDFGDEKFQPHRLVTDTPELVAPEPPPASEEGGRRTGSYSISVLGKTVRCNNLRNLLKASLNVIEDARPGTLEKLQLHKPRSKRVVSQNRTDLYDVPRPPTFSAELRTGWFFSTNNSAPEVIGYIKRAAKLAGLGPSEFKLEMA